MGSRRLGERSLNAKLGWMELPGTGLGATTGSAERSTSRGADRPQGDRALTSSLDLSAHLQYRFNLYQPGRRRGEGTLSRSHVKYLYSGHPSPGAAWKGNRTHWQILLDTARPI
jgi:hypothetical protein